MTEDTRLRLLALGERERARQYAVLGRLAGELRPLLPDRGYGATAPEVRPEEPAPPAN